MATMKEFWSLIFIRGFLLLVEGAIVIFTKLIKDYIPEYLLKVIIGIAICILALIGPCIPTPLIPPTH
jgi:hypothetical protein